MAEQSVLKRACYCGKINQEFIGKTIEVYGWVNKKRELGALTFIDLRDREGILQVVVDENFQDPGTVKKIGSEYVLAVKGTVIARAKANPDLYSGQVELKAEDICILARSKVPPFSPGSGTQVSDELRFKHRYIDLRSLKLQENFRARSQANLMIRNYLDRFGFLDIETPMLSKATPEGARDYLVPSRVYKGRMFALPQSPQLFKQLLMVSGFERYYQIVKCFRDEDLRADRQPEFTQVDIEMSFAEPEELFSIIEGLIVDIFALRGFHVQGPFRLMEYDEAMGSYGTDKPDLRIPYRIQDFTAAAQSLGSDMLTGITTGGGKIKGLVLPGAADYSRKVLDGINDYIRELGGKGAIWMKNAENGFKASVKIEPAAIAAFYKEHGIADDHIVFLLAGPETETLFLAGKLREYCGKDYIEKNKDKLEFLWVVNFPLFFYNQEEQRYDSNHHPFTSPRPEDMELLDSNPGAVKSVAYDLVLNGIEIGGGSRRIHDIEIQKKIFRLLNLTEEEAQEKFGFFLEALHYGAPPHLGIALGFDRIMMLLCGEDSIREVIAFPKTTSSLCMLTGSPTEVAQKQLDELGICFKG